MSPENLANAQSYVAVIIVIAFILMLVNSVINLVDKFRPKSSSENLDARITALESAVSEIKTSCTTCKNEYLTKIGEIHEKINGVKSSVDLLTGELQAYRRLEGKQ